MNESLKYGVIRFRRWSRAPFAVFASLHKSVSIGHVSSDIADASMSKHRTCQDKAACRNLAEEDSFRPEDDGRADEVAALTGIIVPLCELRPGAVDPIIRIYDYNINLCRRMLYAGFPAFFVLWKC